MSHSTTSGGWRRRERYGVAARAQRRAHGGAQIGAAAGRIGTETPRRHLDDRQAHPLDRLPGLGQLLGGHLLEVHGIERLAIGPGERGVDLDLVLVLPAAKLAIGIAGPQRLGQAAAPLHGALGAALRGRPQIGQRQAHHAPKDLWVAPEHVEGLVEELPLVAPVDQDRVQRPVEIVAPGQPDRPHRLDRRQDLAGPDR
jgi:hypothetical protein